jgi:cellulose synthase/poly-beta-1,6-N-acetylglucosamine synthase-like glycosyltransferase
LLILLVVFFAAVAIQTLYLLAFLIAFKRKRSIVSYGAVPVSVVVCAHDEEVNLVELIPQLLSQNHPAFEVIIVNDRSNDSTYDFLLEETKKDKRLRMVHVDRLPSHVNAKKYALTLGIKAATHEWILLTDADCRPNGNDWISSMSSRFGADTQFVIGVSPYKKNPGFLNLFIRFESLFTILQYIGFSFLKNPYMGVGRNLAYRKSLFLEKKGFNQFSAVIGGDDDLFVNQHAKSTTTAIQIVSESHMVSIPKTTLKSYFHQKVRHLSVGKYYRFMDRFLLGTFGVTWILTWFTVAPLLVFSELKVWVLAAILLRIIVLIITFQAAIKKMGLRFELWVIPVLDFLYSMYYISTGVAALVTKKIRWRN